MSWLIRWMMSSGYWTWWIQLCGIMKRKSKGEYDRIITPDTMDVTVIRNVVSKQDVVLLSFNSKKESVGYAMDPHAFLQLYEGLKDVYDEIHRMGYA